MTVATFVVGRLLRRAFRRRLISDGFEFREDKGWLDSQFCVTVPYHRSDAMRQILRDATSH